MMRPVLIALTIAMTLPSLAKAQAPAQAPAAEPLTDKDVPKSVTARLACKKPAGPVTVRAFAGGFAFVQSCLSSNDTPEHVVFATDKTGTGARLLQFHRPEGRRLSALGSITFSDKDNEIAGTIGRLSRRICRAEGAWKMEGKNPQPALAYWRQTRDCDGKTGWQTLLGRKR